MEVFLALLTSGGRCVREEVLNTVHVTQSLLLVIRDEAQSKLSHAEYAGIEPAGPYPRSHACQGNTR
jgi:hypothetical protein